MMTHMQTARLSTANNLFEARDQLLACANRVCFDAEESCQIHALVSQIDLIMAKLIPNKPCTEHES